MNKKSNILCRAELLSIIYTASEKNKKLSKMQIIYLHYLMRNSILDKSSMDNLTRYHKTNLFTLCDYDSSIKRLILKDFVTYDAKQGKLFFKVTSAGKEFISKLKSSYMSNNLKKITDIFTSPIDEKKLRDEIIPMVRITK